jgi:co-chaperonin GroES (HSP10)
MPQMAMVHATDPAQLIWDTITKKVVGSIDVFGNQVLIGIYLRPEKTKTNIYIPDQTRKEDQWQGKAGLVLKMGPKAFVSDENYDFGTDKVEVGDWVAIFVADGHKIDINKQLCRLVEDQHIRLKIPAPDLVW